jgi:hypothetical protein
MNPAPITTSEPATPAPSATVYECPDCDWTGTLDDMDGLHHLHHIHERISAGELVPAGVCPECRAMISVDDADVPHDTLQTVAYIMRARGWTVSAPDSPPSQSPDPVRKDIAEALRDGVAADIWYDAHQYGDTDKATQIEEVQNAMVNAAALLDPNT